ncbi:MAG: hypothetical protein PHO81_05675, partial [Candidatus Omnitrophica bacterium]|nr:hypothetical protein [Candidatus Omnitrophota bacterium]
YISIDKDCLKNDFALTNWEEGFLTLKQLLVMLKILRDNLEIIGLDITGEYSPVSVSGRLKGLFSRLDHPRRLAADGCSPDSVIKVNEQTNLDILQALFP